MSLLKDELDPQFDGNRVNVEAQSQLTRESRGRNVEEECRAVLNSSLRTAAETNQMAQATAEELKAQSEQINRIHQDSRETEHNLKTTEFLIKGMKGWWSSLIQIFQEPPKRPVVADSGRRVEEHAPMASAVEVQKPLSGNMVEPKGDFDRAMASDLTQLSSMLEEMRCRAVETGHELKYQNEELQSVHDLINSNDARLAKQRKELEKLSKF